MMNLSNHTFTLLFYWRPFQAARELQPVVPMLEFKECLGAFQTSCMMMVVPQSNKYVHSINND
jgi:hypothetical protein